MGENAYKLGDKTTSHRLKLRFRNLNPISYLELTKLIRFRGNFWFPVCKFKKTLSTYSIPVTVSAVSINSFIFLLA
ncbi:hypothetical protein QQG55_44230 [Brugia pahangi]